MVNRLVALDPDGVAALAGLDGKVVRIVVVGTAIEYTMRIGDGRIVRLRDQTVEPNAGISGTPAVLLRLLLDGDLEAACADPGFEVTGDRALVERVCEIRRRTAPDFEELLSRVVGDIAAHQIGNLARGSGEWARRAGRSILADVGEYLSEEARYVAAAPELEAFSSDVAALGERLDRLTERIERVRRLAAVRRA